eukprot:EG_transcript_15343
MTSCKVHCHTTGQRFQQITAAYGLLRSGKSQASWDGTSHRPSEEEEPHHTPYEPPDSRWHSSPPDFPTLYVLGLLGASAMMLVLASYIISWDRRRQSARATFPEMSTHARMLRLDSLYHNRPNSLRMAEFAYRSELAQRTPVHAAAHCPREAATPAAAPRPTPPPAGAHVCRNDRYELCGCCDFAGPPAPATVVAVMVAEPEVSAVLIAIPGPDDRSAPSSLTAAATVG